MRNQGPGFSIAYSVVIRTLGEAGEKYQALLDSLKKQPVQPREVLVVIGDGCPLPKERFGTERFISTRKGMVHQRHLGMQLAQADYLLVCDDDISFEGDLVDKLYRTSLKTHAEIVIPRVISPEDEVFGSLKTWAKSVRDIFGGNTYVSSKPSRYSIRIWGTGGYVRNAHIEKGCQYYSQSGHGTCSLINRGAAIGLDFQDEFWLEDAGYPLPDDQVMFYKAFLQGNRIAWCQEAICRHLDAGGDRPDRSKHMSYAHARNFTIFWHRFLFKPNTHGVRALGLIGWLAYRILNNSLLYAFRGLLEPRRRTDATLLLKGYVDAFRYIRSERYRRLPVVCDRRAEERGLA